MQNPVSASSSSGKEEERKEARKTVTAESTAGYDDSLGGNDMFSYLGVVACSDSSGRTRVSSKVFLGGHSPSGRVRLERTVVTGGVDSGGGSVLNVLGVVGHERRIDGEFLKTRHDGLKVDSGGSELIERREKSESGWQ